MDFGIIFANTGPFTEPQAAAAFARRAEEVGFESLWTVEHVVVPSGYESTYPYDPSGKMPGNDDAPIPDPLIWLSYLAGVTSTINLATGILIVPQRNPVILAKELASLAPFEADGLVKRTATGFDVTDSGRLFIRNIAMCFDNTLGAAGERKYSKTI